MEYIVIDTNIFYRNWFLQNANFAFLANYVENTGAILLLSKIVNEEVQNKYEVERENTKISFQKTLKQLKSFYQYDLDFPVAPYSYDFKTILKSKFRKIEVIEYHSISNEVMVDRAIKRIAPFKENEKGFRDTLIWLSLLAYLSTNQITEDIVFITENYTDYLDKGSQKFKSELLLDIENHKLSCQIKPFINLQSFIDTLDKDEYENATMAERLQELVIEHEEDIESGIEFYLNRLSPTDFQKLFALKSKYPFIDTLLDFRLEVIEGIEDLHIKHHKKIEEKKYYVNCELDLRICSFLFGIPENDYAKSKDTIDLEFTNQYLTEDKHAYFEKYARPKLNVNFIVHLESEVINGIEVIEAIFNIRE